MIAVCPNCGAEAPITHPGDAHLTDTQAIRRATIAECWRAIQSVAGDPSVTPDPADECRRLIAALGNKG